MYNVCNFLPLSFVRISLELDSNKVGFIIVRFIKKERKRKHSLGSQDLNQSDTDNKPVPEPSLCVYYKDIIKSSPESREKTKNSVNLALSADPFSQTAFIFFQVY